MTSPTQYLRGKGISRDLQVRISHSMAKIARGSDAVIRTPFMEDKTAEQILDLFDKEVWSKRGDSIDHKLYEIEMNNRSKFGPRSIAKPWDERESATMQYFTHQWPKFSQVSTNFRWRKGVYRPLDLSTAARSLPKKTNSGLPYLMRKGKAISMTLEDYDRQIGEGYAAILGTRTQEGNKTRDIWQWPLAANIREARYYRVYLERVAKLLHWRAAIVHPDLVDRSITGMLQWADRDPNIMCVGVDFSSFDQSVGPNLHRSCFNEIAGYFRPEYEEEIQAIRSFFSTIPLITPSGVIFGEHGVPSGSVWTNEIDSLAQFEVSTVAQLRHDVWYTSFQIQGDDGVYLISKKHVDDFMQTFVDEGFVVNASKSDISRDYLIYLQRYYARRYFRRDIGYIGGIYPIFRALGRICFLERWQGLDESTISGAEYFSMRAISILENCKYHPLFRDLINFVLKHDATGLTYQGLNLTEFARLRSAERSGLINQYGDTGFSNFETVKILRSLR